MSKRFDLRKERLKKLKGTKQHFVGKIARGTQYEVDGVKKVLVSPLYVEIDGAYSYIEHSWMLLPEEYSSKIGYTIDFQGEVYEYKKESGEKGYGMDLVSVESLEEAESYDELKMDFIESTDLNKKVRRCVNSNLSIIVAFENGEDLRVSRKGRERAFAQRIKVAQRFGKRAENPNVWDTLAWTAAQ